MVNKKFKFLEHTADVKFQAFGKTIEQVFVNSALAEKETICGKKKILSKIKKEIKVTGKDNESLLYNFLEQFLYLLDAEDFLLNKIKAIKIVNGKLKATCLGDSAKKYKFRNSVKAVTYNEMFVKKDKNPWISQVVLDV
ncbi:Protein archease [uncultured archaeon]|nr:Protein archease [uncultured archaeon]